MKHKIAILIPYFGEWPTWMNFFVESCRSNPTIDWIIIGDSAPPENSAPNVRYLRTSFAEYIQLIADRLGAKMPADTPYKLCDMRPALPYLHAELLAAYDFVGFGDLDVIFGNIGSFYDDRLLSQYDLFSSHPDRVSGHLCLMRNREDVTTAFKAVRGWKKAFARTDYVNFDERAFYNLFAKRRLFKAGATGSVRCFFREAYSTPAPSDRIRWFWKDGRLTNEYYPHHPLMYLHFMSWHSNRWYGDLPNVPRGTPAPWSQLPEVVQMDWRDARREGFMISPAGIQPLPRDAYAGG